MKRAIPFLSVFLSLLILASVVVGQDDIIGPDNYPEGINPLTGLVVDDPELLNRRPLLIKISNFPPVVRTYQQGLNEAEIVWEHLLSGGVTRFSAVIYANDFEKIGPVRSGRLVDFELTRIYRSLFTYSGMSQGTTEVLFGDALMLDRVVGGSGPCPPLCRVQQEGLALEHTLFGNTLQIREDLAAEREVDVTPEPVYGMAFSEGLPEGGTAISSLLVRYRESQVEWVYDEADERWLRFQDGEAHVDANGVQVNAANVVVFEAVHTIQPFVSDQYWGPPNFAFSTPFIGTGRIFYLRDGKYWQGEWRRETREDPLTYFDLDGNILPFKPGNTFVNLVPLWFDGYELNLNAIDAPEVVVNGSTGVSMRYGPNEQYVSPDVAYAGDTFVAIGRKYDGTWLQVRRGDERSVWLPLERLDIGELDVMRLPITRPLNERG